MDKPLVVRSRFLTTLLVGVVFTEQSVSESFINWQLADAIGLTGTCDYKHLGGIRWEWAPAT